MSLCNSAIVATDGYPFKLAATLKCRSWSCAECAELRRQKLFSEIKDGQPTRHLILTDRRKPGKDPLRVVKNLARALRGIIDHERRNNPEQTYEYYAVIERTKLGWPHLHAALRAPRIEHAWMSAWMEKHFDSPNCWITFERDHSKLAGYLANYMAEEPAKFGSNKRYWHSKAYALTPWVDREQPDRWCTRDETLTDWCDWQRRKGWHCVAIGTDRAKATAPGVHEEATP